MRESGKMTDSITGKIYDIQGFSVQDGPGIRTTIFLKGCPLRCLWCHSPESQLFETQLLFMELKCVGVEKCGMCIEMCPEKAISKGEITISPIDDLQVQHIRIDRAVCTNCGKCAEICFAKALYRCGDDYTVEDVMMRIRKDIPFYKSSGSGGVTISGGEALSQPRFTETLLRACKEEGINTALDTTGFAKYEIISKLIPYVDLFLYDLKSMNDEVHIRVTGVSNELILDNARKLAEDGAHFQFRIPVIPGVNCSEDEIKAIGEFVLSLHAHVDMIQLLPYHKFGSVKYDRFQGICPMPDDVEPPSEQEIAGFARILKHMGFNVSIH
jgi:pyruvate formate lyase activating enzyme